MNRFGPPRRGRRRGHHRGQHRGRHAGWARGRYDPDGLLLSFAVLPGLACLLVFVLLV